MIFKNERSPFIAKSALRRRSSSVVGTPRSRLAKKKHKSNIKVCVRVRPLNNAEQLHFDESRVVVRVLGENVLVFDPTEQQTPSYYKGKVIRDPTARRNKDLKFAFDSVFDCQATNQDVYQHTTKLAIEKLLEGKNCSVFAYGATGAGKTYTMVGNSEQPGVICQTMQELYESIESMQEDVLCDVKICYLEIYNENVRDLMKPESGDLPLRDADQGLTVTNLSFHSPENADHLLEILDFGNRNRTQHPTDANKESSRSHAVFQVFLEQRPRTADVSADVLISKMSLIDLAGSERATATKNFGERFREGANINRSLLALGNCINALAEGKRGAHIPYRDSKLTRILKDSLGGNCQTIMIANVSPSCLSYEDTYNTLKYADRAKQIKADAKKNVLHIDYHVHQYAKIVQDLQAELGEVKGKLKSCRQENQLLMHKVENLEAGRRVARSKTQVASLLQNIRPMVENYVKLAKDLLHNESQYRLQELRLNERRRIQRQLEVVQVDLVKRGKDTEKTERIKSQCHVRQESLRKKVEQCQDGLVQLKLLLREAMATFVAEHNELEEDAQFVIEALEKQTIEKQLGVENEHLRSVIDQECGVVENQNKLICQTLELALEQHLIISGNDRMTNRLKENMENVIRLAQGIKEVAWSDENSERPAFELHPLPDLHLQLGPSGELRSRAGASAAKENFQSFSPSATGSPFHAVKSLNFGTFTKKSKALDCEEKLGMNDTFTRLPGLDLDSPEENWRPCNSRGRLRSPPPPLVMETFEQDENCDPTGVSLPLPFQQPCPRMNKEGSIGECDISPRTVPLRGILTEKNAGNLLKVPSVTVRPSNTEEFKKPTMLPPGKKKRPALGMEEASKNTIARLKKFGLPSATEKLLTRKQKTPVLSPRLQRSPSCSKLTSGFECQRLRLKKTSSVNNLNNV